MFKAQFTVGGEFVFSPSIFLKPNLHQFSDYAANLSQYHRFNTFGAYYSYKVLIEHLRFLASEYALLPSYLCPTMIEPFARAGVKYDFYKMKEGLLPDLEDIERKTNSSLKAVLFVDYFGFPQREYLAETVSTLRSKGIKTIQDTVQSWLNNEHDLYADYCLNSVRKYSPFEASILLSREQLDYRTDDSLIRKFLVHKRYAQLLRYYHLNYGLFQAETFLKHIDISNNSYHFDPIIDMPPMNRWLLDRIDFQAMGRKRRIVYRELVSKLNPTPVLSTELAETVPLGLPVYLEDRDSKKNGLHKLSIHCPLHWRLSDEIDKQEHDFSWDLQDHALTLPVNVKLQDLAIYIEKLKEVLG